jgi:hypothetical protein
MIITLELSNTGVVHINGACLKAERPAVRAILKRIRPAIYELGGDLKPVMYGTLEGL